MSDYLSRLEDREQAASDEEVMRDVLGVMFIGESVRKVLTPIPAFLIIHYI